MTTATPSEEKLQQVQTTTRRVRASLGISGQRVEDLVRDIGQLCDAVDLLVEVARAALHHRHAPPVDLMRFR